MRLLDAADTEGDLLAAVESAPVVELVNKLLFEALRARASDVHLQPAADEMIVRYRIDGVLHSVATYPPAVLEPVVSRIKVMARMDITEKRLPQDGRTTVRLGNKSVDLRISTVPSDYGERVVVRLLDRAAGVFGLEELGMSPHHLEAMDRIAHSDSGLFFCTGPTGSGKTTTLYAALSRVDSRERNIITLEDPIEYHLPGITQLPAGEKKGMTFASGLRSILRQDPDVIMVGEVRDVETARMAVRAAQTGHLVLSTLHTSDSAGAVARLLDLGVEPFLLASVLEAVLAQRLVRTVCPDCGEPYEPPPAELSRLGLARPDADATWRRGAGCENCLETGYYGRTGLFELLLVDEPIRELIKERADAGAIREQADRTGVAALRDDGVAKATSGITTVEEVLRVTGEGL
jgi:general secretion pathway protein E